jgi:hypothetical protein
MIGTEILISIAIQLLHVSHGIAIVYNHETYVFFGGNDNHSLMATCCVDLAKPLPHIASLPNRRSCLSTTSCIRIVRALCFGIARACSTGLTRFGGAPRAPHTLHP